MDVDKLPPGTPTLVPVVLIVLGWVLSNSDRLAKIAGPIGAIARARQTRDLRELERAETLDQKITEAVRRRTAEEMRPLREQMQQLECRLKTAEEELRAERQARLRDKHDARVEIETRDVEIALLNRWAAKAIKREYSLREWAASEGLQLPGKPLELYAHWRESRRKHLEEDDTEEDD